MKTWSIGFTAKSADHFFRLLRTPGIRRIVDVRLNNTGQLAGFSKRDDLKFFLREICQLDYVHVPELAPTADILDRYKKHGGDWSVYETEFLNLLERRRIDEAIARDVIDGGCLLCSEHKPHRCHRRLVIEYLRGKWGDIEVDHLT